MKLGSILKFLPHRWNDQDKKIKNKYSYFFLRETR
jgi:hypothetical protein